VADPTYMIRAIPGNAADNVYCTLLAHSVIHGAMAGFTGFTAGPVNNRHCYIPIARAVETQRRVNVSDRMWARLVSSTNQPSFFHDKGLQKRNMTENGDNDFTEDEYETNGDSQVNGYTDNGSENLNTEDAEQPALATTIPPADPNVSQNNHAP
jgi:6-phosphofructokinase 1